MCPVLGTPGGGGGTRAFSTERLEQGREGEVRAGAAAASPPWLCDRPRATCPCAQLPSL